ncbi:hypothetical protein AB0E62_34090 [Streptomyces sp. NPDC038707]|uniref:hypothetical protein n=1 Tax=Streptomyces sp. NPDC038707 TaxID=3154329 RepID=UPI0033C75A6F
MAAYATVFDYEARAAVTLQEPQRTQVEALLEDIAALIRTSIPAGTVPDPDAARAVSVAVARRTMANPGGYRQRTVGQYSETLGETGGMYLTDAELEMLTTNDSGNSGDSAYSVGLRDNGPAWMPDHGHYWHHGW